MKKILLFLPILLIVGCRRKEPLILESQKTIKTSFKEKKKIEKVVVPAEVKKNIKYMNFEEAQRAKEYYEQVGDMTLVIKCLKHMRDTTKDIEKIADLIFELAMLELAVGEYEKAQLHFKEFKILYPGDTRVKEVLYHEMLAHLFDRLESGKDQTKTYELLGMAEAFLQEFNNLEDPYTQKVLTIVEECYRLLLQHEIESIRFYLHKFNYTHQAHLLLSVVRRLAYIHKELLPHLIPFNNSLLTLDNYLTELLSTVEEWQLSWEHQQEDKEKTFVRAQESVDYIKAVQEGEQVISHAAHEQQATQATRQEIEEQARILEKAVTHIEYTILGAPVEKAAQDRF